MNYALKAIEEKINELMGTIEANYNRIKEIQERQAEVSKTVAELRAVRDNLITPPKAHCRNPNDQCSDNAKFSLNIR